MNFAAQPGWRERRVRAAGAWVVVFDRDGAHPQARTMLLIHGLGYWAQAAWDELVPQLHPDLRLIAFDLPGFGRSEKPDVRYDSRFFRCVVADVIDQLAADSVIVCGHSLGGYIAAHYAAVHPERVSHLILIAPAGFLRAKRFVLGLAGSQLARWLFVRRPTRFIINQTLDRSVHDPASIAAATRATTLELAEQPELRRAFAGVYTGAIQEFRAPAIVHAGLRAYRGPALLVWGRHDRFIPIRSLERALDVYPQAVVQICERSAHLPMVEEPLVVAAAIERFLL